MAAKVEIWYEHNYQCYNSGKEYVNHTVYEITLDGPDNMAFVETRNSWMRYVWLPVVHDACLPVEWVFYALHFVADGS